MNPKQRTILVCQGTGCVSCGAEQLQSVLETEIAKLNLDGSLKVKRTGCHGFCQRGPIVIIEPEGIFYSKLKPEERIRFFEGHLKKSMPTAVLGSLEILPEELRDTSQPLTINMVYSADNLMVSGDGSKMLNLPRLGGSLGFANFLIGQTGLEERKYPLYTRMTAGIEETLQLKVPDRLGQLSLPEFTLIDTESVTWNMAITQADGLLSSGQDSSTLVSVDDRQGLSSQA